MKYLYAFMLALLCFACNSPNSGQSADTKGEAKPSDECYLYTVNNDNLYLHLHFSGNTVTGDMAYHFASKDSNKGTITGEMHGDTLFGVYTFQSEGVTSEREIAFMRVGKNITEGYGPVEDKDGKMQFMDKSKLEFDDNPVWEAVGCR